MGMQLDDVEVRALGALMEKEIATPEYYPLSLNALVNACNQKSNRERVLSYDEDTVETALDGLRAKGLAARISGHDMRVPKHAHRLSEVINLGRREAAVLCVLMLRGPQTTGELRGRTERLYQFDDLEAVDACLARLMEWEPAGRIQRSALRPLAFGRARGDIGAGAGGAGSLRTRESRRLGGAPTGQRGPPGGGSRGFEAAIQGLQEAVRVGRALASGADVPKILVATTVTVLGETQ